MRRYGIAAAALVVITLLLCGIFATSAAGGAKLINDGSDCYICKSDSNSVTVQNIKTSKIYEYKYKYKVLDYYITGATLYTVTSTDQAGVFMLASHKKGSLVREIVFSSKRISTGTAICVDGSGNFYFLNTNGYVEVFNSTGIYLRTTSKSFFSITRCGASVYAANSDGLYRLKADNDTRICECRVSSGIYSVSDNYIADVSGNVFDIKLKKRVFTLGSTQSCSIGETSKYFVSLSGATVSLYDKSDGSLVSSRELSYKPYGLFADGKLVYILKKSVGDFSVKTYNQSNFLPKASTNSDTVSPRMADTSAKSTGLSFGSYKVSGRFLYLPASTTRAEFREKISYEGYTLKFSRSAGMGTGTKAVFTKGNETYTYTIVVRGDISGTGKITARDVDIMFNCLFGIDKVKGAYRKAADMNGDGKLSNVDLVMIDRMLD